LCALCLVRTADSFSFGGHTYKLVRSLLTWDEARAAAVADGGYLATLTTQAEIDFANAVIATGTFFACVAVCLRSPAALIGCDLVRFAMGCVFERVCASCALLPCRRSDAVSLPLHSLDRFGVCVHRRQR
jgi:hypothetical protein